MGNGTDNSNSSSTDSGSSATSSKSGEPRPLNPGWHFTVVTSAFTLGSVFAPYTLGTAGWFWGSVMWVYSYATTWWSGILIGRCVLHGSSRGAGCSYPEMMADAFGAPGYYFTAGMQILTYYLVNVSLLVNAADWFLLVQEVLVVQGNLKTGPLCLWEYLIVSGVLVGLLAQIRTFKKVLPLAALSLLSTLVRQGLLYYQIASKDLLSECEPKFGGVTAHSSIISLATTAFLFGGHGLFPEEIRELRRPASFFNALHASYVIIGIVYATNAYVAYAVWGQWTAADNQMNWPLNTATLISALLSILWGLVEMTMSHVMMLSLIESHVGLGKPGGQGLRRALLRSAVVASEVFVAFMFSSAGLGNLQGVVAAFGFTALTYYAPFAAYWKLVLRPGESSLCLQLCYGAVCLSGVLLTVAGVYASTAGMAEEIAAYRLFDTSRCSVADIVNVASCDNPCHSAYGFDSVTCVSGP